MTGQEMRQARERKGLSRAMLGDFLGGYWSDKQIKHWENTHPPEHLEQRIREVLDMQGATKRHWNTLRTSSGVRFGAEDVVRIGTDAQKPAGFDQKRSGGHSRHKRCDQIRNKKTLIMNAERWAREQNRVTKTTIRIAFGVDEDEADEIFQFLKRNRIIRHMGYVTKRKGQG